MHVLLWVRSLCLSGEQELDIKDSSDLLMMPFLSISARDPNHKVALLPRGRGSLNHIATLVI